MNTNKQTNEQFINSMLGGLALVAFGGWVFGPIIFTALRAFFNTF